MKLYSKDGGKTSIFAPPTDSDFQIKENWLLEKISFLGLDKSFYSKEEIDFIENVLKKEKKANYIECLESAKNAGQKREKKKRLKGMIIFLILFIPASFIISKVKDYVFGEDSPVGEYYFKGEGLHSDEEYIKIINEDGTFISKHLDNGKEDLDLRIEGTWEIETFEENTTKDAKKETYIFFKNTNNLPLGVYRFNGCISGCDDSDFTLFSNNGKDDYMGAYLEGGISIFGRLSPYETVCPE